MNSDPAGGFPCRTFAALIPPREVRDRLVELRDSLADPALRWVTAANLHLTLRFFGDLERPQVEAASQALEETTALVRSFTLRLQGVGVFPGWRRPRVLWVGIAEGAPRLEALVRELNRRFVDAGLEGDARAFRPHLTLARWRESPEDVSRVRAWANAVAVDETVLVDRLHLVCSRLERGRPPRYDTLFSPALRASG